MRLLPTLDEITKECLYDLSEILMCTMCSYSHPCFELNYYVNGDCQLLVHSISCVI